MSSKDRKIMEGKIQRGMLWLIFLFIIGLLAGIGIYKFRTPNLLEEKNIPEQTKVKPVEKTVVKPEEASSETSDAEIPSDSDPDFIAEEPLDSVPEEMEEEKVAEKIENMPLNKKELTSIYVPLTKSLFSASDASIDAFRNRIMQSEHPARGKIYYQGENGLIESFLSVDEKGVIREMLFSYDPFGNPVDELEIGWLVPDSPERKYATVLVNKLSVFELTLSQPADKKQERVTEYFITPQLRFRKGRTFTKLL